MKVHVDRSLCQSHGQCVLAADQVFRLDDDLNLHYDPEPGDEFRAKVEDAAQMCPTQAITVDRDV
jgi:ferredoxin